MMPHKALIAAHMQSPSFDAERDVAVNYGAIGAIIGHELTHGFDSNGRQYDAYGNFKDWWTPEDTKKYNAKTKKIGMSKTFYSCSQLKH
jgi:putative endopeptidase